jgi:hypothetical protein
VTFTCNAAPPPPPVCPDPNNPACPPVGLTPAIVNGCDLGRDSTGTFFLDIVGRNIKRDATVTVGGRTPKKIKFRDAEVGNPGAFTRITVKKGGLCSGLPGNILITNPGGAPVSTAFFCNKSCPAN